MTRGYIFSAPDARPGAGTESGYPFVSVIIPVYNNAERLQQTLEALRAQTYPADRYEVLVVDNGSTDGSPDVARAFDAITLLYELEHLSSPYSARNRGIEAASGDVIALLDATCVPAGDWMEQGVRCLSEQEADLVGGNVEFTFQGEEPTAGELYDALTNVQMKESVNRNKAKTGNLFVRREVFDELGTFPEGIRSGGDVRWTRRATEEGFTLVYCAGAKTYYPARHLGPLIRKQWRVGKGKAEIERQKGHEVGPAKLLILAVLPPGFEWLKEKAEQRGYLTHRGQILKLWLVRYVINFVMKVAQGYEVLRSRIEPGRDNHLS